MIKKWTMRDDCVCPDELHPNDVLDIINTRGDVLRNQLARDVKWNDPALNGYEIVTKFATGAGLGVPGIPQPIAGFVPRYEIPEGYNFIETEWSYQQYRESTWTDKQLKDVGYLVPVAAPSAVPVNYVHATGDKEPLKLGADDRRYTAVTESPIREDLDPASRYYDAGGIETIDVIKAKLTPEQLRGYLLGNLIKYSCRMNFKGSAVRDAEKCKYYSQWLAELEQDNV